MKLTEQIKHSWPFLITTVIYVLLVIISTSGIVTVHDFYFGIIYILLAVSMSYVCLQSGKRLQEKGKKYWRSSLIVYAGGFMSASWLIQAIDFLL
jgi:hypothetical protein